jgi:hypothetical protein
MVSFSTTILKFDSQGEKTGWTYIEISAAIAEKLNPGVKKGYQVKGKLDDYAFKGFNLLPMGEGKFILALKADVRKKLGKKKGDKLTVELSVDKEQYKINEEFLECLADEPKAEAIFLKMPGSHQKYYSKWIESGKTDETRAKRIAMAVNALLAGLDFGAMLRKARDERQEFGI